MACSIPICIPIIKNCIQPITLIWPMVEISNTSFTMKTGWTSYLSLVIMTRGLLCIITIICLFLIFSLILVTLGLIISLILLLGLVVITSAITSSITFSPTSASETTSTSAITWITTIISSSIPSTSMITIASSSTSRFTPLISLNLAKDILYVFHQDLGLSIFLLHFTS